MFRQRKLHKYDGMCKIILLLLPTHLLYRCFTRSYHSAVVFMPKITTMLIFNTCSILDFLGENNSIFMRLMKSVWTYLLEQLGVTTTDQAVSKNKMMKVCFLELFLRSDWKKEPGRRISHKHERVVGMPTV